MVAYAELQVLSNFSFLEGASHAEELVRRAGEVGLSALGIADRNTLAGVVRAHGAAKEYGVKLLVGARLDLEDGPSLIAYPQDRAAYGHLSRLITLGRRRAPKGACYLQKADIAAWCAGMQLIAVPPDILNDGFQRDVQTWAALFPGAVSLAASCRLDGHDAARLRTLAVIAQKTGVPLVAVNDVLMHGPERRALADVLSCIRTGCTIETAGRRTLKNAERHVKSGAAMAVLFADYPDAVARTLDIVARCRFSLDELAYEYPDDIAPNGRTPQEELAYLTERGAKQRYPGGVPDKVRAQLDHELTLIAQLAYAPYFLTVHDIVQFARGQGILCQGRGSAANSAVCYALGITAVDPARIDLLFERFISTERDEPPDIDVDFEHERREEVIQYIYQKYGRERAGLAATVIHYRARRAVREVGKAMGLSEDIVAALAKQARGRSSTAIDPDHVRELGLDPDAPDLKRVLILTEQLIGFPRHLSQHVGGFVITRGRLDELVPVENAAMDDRTVIEWDKDDLDTLGILKIDVLALGMLSCIRRCFHLIRTHYGRPLDLASIPAEDPAVYDMLCKADAIGVFQVESRAQMAFLPRMKPRNFYDLVIEVAIVRPGPIQGDMVHPYIRRRNGEEPVHYPSKDLEKVLGKTLGVPLFQEQAMKVAMVGAGFSGAEADKLRRAMATFRRSGMIETFRDKMVGGMTARGYDQAFAERCFRQIEGFGEYGFPESHAASFALLVYVSAWLKCHYPDVFACALLNSQPMGFYRPAQIVRDAQNHAIEVRPADVNFSDWDNTLELSQGGPKNKAAGAWALRLGLRQIKGLARDDADWLVAARGNGYGAPADIWRRAGLTPAALEKLARADAFASLKMARRDAFWAIRALGDAPLPLFAHAGEDDRGADAPVVLPKASTGEDVMEDYAYLGLSLRTHPMALLRPRLDALAAAESLLTLPVDRKLSVAGLVLVRQRPGTAKGVIFLTLEDDTGIANIIVWPKVFEQYRARIFGGSLLRVTGRLQREGIVAHVVADHIEDLTPLLGELALGDHTTDNARPARRVPDSRDWC